MVCVTLPLRRITEPSHCGTVLTLRLLGCDSLCGSIAIRFLRSSMPSQRVTKLCIADAGRFYATAPLCISGTLRCNSLAILSRAFALPHLALPRRCISRASQCRCFAFPCPSALFLCCVLPSQSCALPTQIRARPLLYRTYPMRRLGLQFPSYTILGPCGATLRFAYPLP